jgi:copper chaperone CopZ
MDAVLEVPAAEGSRTHVGLQVEGMTCASCAGRVERALNRLSGVKVAVNLDGSGGCGCVAWSENSSSTEVAARDGRLRHPLHLLARPSDAAGPCHPGVGGDRGAGPTIRS